MNPTQVAEEDVKVTCAGAGPLKHADCPGCACECHWLPPASVGAGDFDDLF